MATVVADAEGLGGTGQPVTPAVGTISFANLDATDFEEFCHDLLLDVGFVNVDWRKGTPKKASPSDRGRDLVAQRELVDVDGHRRFETWFVDCKHHKRGVPPETLQGLLAWSESERPDVALVVASGFLSDAAKDWLEDCTCNRRPPFRVRHWEKPTLARMLRGHPDLLARHGIFMESMRTQEQILAAEQEYFDKVWYVRKLILEEATEDGRGEPLPAGLQAQMQAAMRKVEERYGVENLGPWDDWGWGFVHGELSALRWVLGEEWDFLDT